MDDFFGDAVLAIVKGLVSNIPAMPAMRPAGRPAGGSRGGALPARTRRIACHNQLRDVFYHTLVPVGVQVDRENASPGSGHELRPGDCPRRLQQSRHKDSDTAQPANQCEKDEGNYAGVIFE